ncbi:hypothetical protein DFH08DRAFT_1084831 [Mycena albidolilacea]|uniref:Uncharacterized protein n=1 Tax=Mycena albidolilacea TaxID=1033008 RepID=A0AAD7EHT6_9AGAR|nr:hypothetical protein DFH08DRAFT_1084831 [Mycena albidolilacea]
MPTSALTPIPKDPGSIEHEVDANGLDEVGRILVNNMNFMTAVSPRTPWSRQRACSRKSTLTWPLLRSPPLMCIRFATTTRSRAVFAPVNPIPAICTFIGCWTPRCVALLDVQHRVPPDSMVPAESMLAQIDVHLAAAEKSCTNVRTSCHNDALPRTELTRLHDVLDALDGVLALLALRRFVHEAIDAPGRFREKQALL